MITAENIEREAVSLYGEEVVSQVRETVEMSDPDAAYTMFEDMEMFEHSECVDFLYFSNL